MKQGEYSTAHRISVPNPSTPAIPARYIHRGSSPPLAIAATPAAQQRDEDEHPDPQQPGEFRPPPQPEQERRGDRPPGVVDRPRGLPLFEKHRDEQQGRGQHEQGQHDHHRQPDVGRRVPPRPTALPLPPGPASVRGRPPGAAAARGAAGSVAGGVGPPSRGATVACSSPSAGTARPAAGGASTPVPSASSAAPAGRGGGPPTRTRPAVRRRVGSARGGGGTGRRTTMVGAERTRRKERRTEPCTAVSGC